LLAAEIVHHFEDSGEGRTESVSRENQGVLKGFRFVDDPVDPLLHVNVDLGQAELILRMGASQHRIKIGQLGFGFVGQGDSVCRGSLQGIEPDLRALSRLKLWRVSVTLKVTLKKAL
jgi:hypothetical protein